MLNENNTYADARAALLDVGLQERVLFQSLYPDPVRSSFKIPTLFCYTRSLPESVGEELVAAVPELHPVLAGAHCS
nr:hypothetical protein BaRGS_017128 [Batillaria attramentaria]